MRAATALDPTFPLYAARAAWLAWEGGQREPEVAARSLAAARAGKGLAPFFLIAGLQGQALEVPWAPEALAEAQKIHIPPV